MLPSAKPFHLAFFLGGPHIQGWGREWSGNIADEFMGPELYEMVARELERGCLDYILLEDNVFVADMAGGMEYYLKYGISVPRRDPMMIAPYMLKATKHIGIVPTVSTFAPHPYYHARQMASLDQLSGGRVGWNCVTGSSDRGWQNFGFDAMLPHDERYDHAAEFIEASNALWDSWEPGAWLADRDSETLVDASKVHAVNFEGKWFKTRGPLNVGPLPQGRPAMAQAGSSDKGREFAAKYADTIVGDGRDNESSKAYRDDLRARAVAIGRDPDEIQFMTLLTPILGESEGEAEEKAKSLEAYNLRNAAQSLALISKTTGIDFSKFPLDEELNAEGLTTHGTQKSLDDFLARNKGKTLREAATRPVDRRWVGTPEQVADRMEEAMAYIGGDGFLLGGVITRRFIAELVDGLIPVLQRRGLTRKVYSGKTLRENLRTI
jgi:FMN-dependent oxidoreductase (nitrilotriacetate monooxygenase family)